MASSLTRINSGLMGQDTRLYTYASTVAADGAATIDFSAVASPLFPASVAIVSPQDLGISTLALPFTGLTATTLTVTKGAGVAGSTGTAIVTLLRQRNRHMGC